MHERDVEVLEPGHELDFRIITPAELVADGKLEADDFDDAAARILSDKATEAIVDLLEGRQPCRQTVVEQVPGYGDRYLEVHSFPIEGHPSVCFRSTVVSRSSYRVDGRCRQSIYRREGWNDTSAPAGTVRDDGLVGEELRDFEVGPFFAGYVPPGSVAASWEANSAYSPGESTSYGASRGSWLRPSRTSGLMFEVAVAGTSHVTDEPAWPTSARDRWRKARVHGAGDWLVPRSSELAFEPTTPGTTGDEEPAWADVEAAGETLQDGTVVWTARDAIDVVDGGVTWRGRPGALEMPLAFVTAARLMARMIDGLERGAEDCDEGATKKKVKDMLRRAC